MSFLDYIFYSVFGLCVVFVVLISLIVIVKIVTIEPKKKVAEQPTASAVPITVVAAQDKPKAPGTAGDLKLYDTNPRDAAMVMAIVADELGVPLNELRFISIREVQ